MNIQERLEADGCDLGIQRYRKNSGSGDTTYGKHLFNRYIHKLKDSLDAWLTDTRASGRGADTKEFFRTHSGSLLEICAVAMKQAWRGAHEHNLVSTLANSIGREIETELLYQQLKNESPYWERAVGDRVRSSKLWERVKILKDSAAKRRIEKPRVSASVGAILFDLMVKQGLFITGYRKIGTKTKAFVSYTPEAEEFLREQRAEKEVTAPRYPIMVEEPEPWCTVIGGGYKYSLRDRLTLLNENASSLSYMEEIHNKRDKLKPVFDVINSIQNTPYRINKSILKVLTLLEEMGCPEVAGLPPSDDIEIPERPPDDSPDLPHWRLEASNIRETNEALKSKRRTLLAQLGCARAWQRFPKIYYPCTVDWRWRIYPIGLPINPQGDSTSKALLEFAEGKPLDSKEAIDSMYVMGANIYGNDKISLEDRRKWVRGNIHEIYDCAKKPEVNLWWTTADKPLYFLAWCIGLYEAEALGKPSHFICSVDGSQNGIQHYALLSRDIETAKAVNVLPSPTPNDLYIKVKDRLEEQLLHEKVQEKLEGTDEGELEKRYKGYKELRMGYLSKDIQIPDGLKSNYSNALKRVLLVKSLKELDRALVKRPVMTFSYSVTSYGITEQIAGELRQREVDRKLRIDKHWIKPVAKFLTKYILEAIESTVSSASSVMEWFKEAAKIGIKSSDRIRWTTPMGVPIEQRYYEMERLRIRLSSGDLNINVVTKTKTKKPNRRRAVAGISPNIIHSLDASHLQLTVILAKTMGVDNFCMVHDSFGCHASDMHKIQIALRAAAVSIYSESVLENLGTELGGTCEFPLGDLDVEKVLESDYFFC